MLVSCGASRGSPFVRDFSFPCYFLVQLRHKDLVHFSDYFSFSVYIEVFEGGVGL